MKKIILGLFLGLVMLVGVNVAYGATTCTYNSATSATCVDDTDQFAMFYYDAGSYGAYIMNNATVPMTINGTTAPMIVDPAYTQGDVRIYSFDSACVTSGHITNTADPDFCGTMTFDLPLSNQQFSDYVAPVSFTGFKLFNTGVGKYHSSDYISQTATAVQASMGGFGPILAIVGGLIFAFGIILYIIGIFNDAKKDKKLYDDIDRNRKRI